MKRKISSKSKAVCLFAAIDRSSGPVQVSHGAAPLRLFATVFIYVTGCCFCWPQTPVITSQPRSQAVLLGGQAVFTVIASSPTPLTFQWRRNGVPIGGATIDTLVLRHTQFSDSTTPDIEVLENDRFSPQFGSRVL